MHNKPYRFGIKAFSICDSKTGYVINWKIYAGKENGKTTSSKDVVLTLLEDFQNKGYHVFTDSFFTSIELMEILQSQGISLTGTIRSTRKYLPKIDNSKLSCQAISKRCKNILLTGWKDKQNLFLVSNLYGRKEVINEKRVKGGTDNSRIQKAFSIKNVQSLYAYGVDLSNQLAIYYRSKHRSSKLYKNIFSYIMIDVTITNCYIVYKQMRKIQKMKSAYSLD